MRKLLTSVFCLVSATLSASENPLTLTQPDAEAASNQRMVTIEEATGAMRLYEMNNGTGTQAMKQLVPGNFLIDLDRIRNIRLVVPNPNRVDKRTDPEFVFWPLVRTGSAAGARGRPSNIPAYGPMYQFFLPKSERPAVFNSEDQFFEKLEDYDGEVRAGLSKEFLLVVIPGTYTILAYRIADDTFDLVSYRNYRPELYLKIPSRRVSGQPSFGSSPSINEVKDAIKKLDGGDILLAERTQEIEKDIEELESDIELIPLQESDPWIKGLSRERFVMADPPNKRIMVYSFEQNDAMMLKSLRNTDLDVRIPSWPLPSRDIQKGDREVVESYMKQLSRLKLDGEVKALTAQTLDWAKSEKELTEVDVNTSSVQISLFRMLAEQQNNLVGGQQSGSGDEVPVDITVDPSERLIMDYKKDRRLLVYLINGQNDELELRASRDYTVETGIASYNYELSKIASAGSVLKQIEKLARRPGDEIDGLTLSNIQYLLAISPESYSLLEDNRRIVKRFSDHELWQPAIEKAIADTAKKQERLEKLFESVKGDFLQKNAALKAAKER